MREGCDCWVKLEYPHAYQSECERVVGHNIVHGRPHGFKWSPLYRVTVEFETKAEAQEFFNSLHEGGIVSSNDKIEQPPTKEQEQTL